MRVGGKARLVCPADTAYGDAGAPPMIPGGATIVFEVELLGTADNSLAIPAEEPTSPRRLAKPGIPSRTARTRRLRRTVPVDRCIGRDRC